MIIGIAVAGSLIVIAIVIVVAVLVMKKSGGNKVQPSPRQSHAGTIT